MDLGLAEGTLDWLPSSPLLRCPGISFREQAMLWDASALDGYAIEASDGRIGSVSDFLFEDTTWIVRWLVVDTGNWLSARKVLLPPSALGTPDPSLRQFPIKLTIQQVED